MGENPDFRHCLSLDFLLTGHGPLNAFLHKRNLHDSEGCECGAELEDVEHVLCECPRYSDVRNLDSMGVKWTDGRYDFGRTLSTYLTVTNLVVFAREVFRRRRRVE